MKKLLLIIYIFFCTGGIYAQERQNVVVAELDFNRPSLEIYVNRAAMRPDTIHATLLLSRGRKRTGYAVIKKKLDVTVQKNQIIDQQLKYDTTYLDDRKRPLRAPVTVWSMKRKEGHP